MKPVIVGITKDGKVDMTFEEFRKHMDDAYKQGHDDNSLFPLPSSSVCGSGSGTHNKWWEQAYYTCNAISNATSTKATEG